MRTSIIPMFLSSIAKVRIVVCLMVSLLGLMPLTSQAALTAGDIAFVQYNADGTDNFSFVALVDIPASEEIKFTDNGWKADNSWRTGEGIVTWTAPAGGVSKGTVVTITTTPSASSGSVSETNDLNFAGSGDQVVAYQGTNAMIAALNNEGSAWQTDATDTNMSALPQGLTNGTNAMALNEIDNAVYTGTLTGDKATLLAAINNPSNWIGSDTANQTLPSGIRITEYMYDGANGEFVELTNVGGSAMNMTGWSFADDSTSPGAFSLSGFGTVQPGESVIFTENAIADFKSAWHVCDGLKVIGNSSPGLGRNDTIKIYNATNTLVDQLAYGDQTYTGTIRTKDKSGWVSVAGLGANSAAAWTLSAVSDGESSYASTGGNIGSPGKSTQATVSYTCPDAAPSVSSTTPANNATTIATNSTITLNFSETVDLTASAVTLGCPSGTAKTFTGLPATNVNTVTLTPSATLPNSTVCTVTVDKTQVTDKDGTPDNMTANHSFSFTTEAIVAGNPPTLTFNTTSTDDLLDGGATTLSSPVAVAGTIGTTDTADPMRTLGIDFTLADSDTAIGSVTVTATSSNTTVVPNVNITISGSGTAGVNVKIQGAAVGYSDITLTANDGSNTANFVIKYAASAAGMATSRYHSGKSDASTAIAIDSTYMLVADDEDQTIRLYDRKKSGLPLKSFDFTSSLGLGGSSEVDIEGATRIGSTIYWLGSHSNNSSGDDKPNRERLFSTTISGTGTATTLTSGSYYKFLEDDLLAWDSGNTHGLGANFFGLTASAANTVTPETTGGFNIEGFTVAPSSTTTAYVAFRAPIVPAASRTKALIVPVTNFTAILNGSGGTTGSATFGTPIQLDLGGRGIRSIECNSNGCLIIAGASDGSGNFKLYRWSGNATDAPVMMGTDLSTTAMTGSGNDGSFESIVELPGGAMNNWVNQSVQLLFDNGDTVYYGDGTIAKELTQANHKKFRSEIVTLTAAPITNCNKSTATHCIHEIQGSGSAITGGLPASVTVEAIVTADYQDSASGIKGFFIQEEANEVDADPMTSEGIFVYCDTCTTAVNVGDKVRVTGSASEFNNMSQITPTAVSVVNANNSLPTSATLTLPVPNTYASKDAYLEQFEGMLVKINGTLTVAENYQLGRFGQVTLAAGGRPQQFTHANAPNTSGYTAHLDTIARQTIILDDRTNAQNPDPLIYPQGNLSASNSLRSGSTTSNLTGVLHYSWGGNASSPNNWRIRSTGTVTFNQAERPTAPPSIGTPNVKVASFNLLNYFNTFGTGNCTNGVSGVATDCRGAEGTTEFTRQKDKHKQVFIGLNADVIGLMELENDGYGGTSAQQDLLNLINSAGLGRNYKMIDADTALSVTNVLGTDAIKVGLIYDDNTLDLVAGSVKTSANAIFDRNPLAATFIHTATGEKFTVVVNHLKSKGSAAGLTGDTDQNDGQGNSNATRVAQAQALVTFLGTLSDDPDILVIGDMNAYRMENPITTIKNAGYTDLLGANKYSYVFDGQIGYLDHALASSTLVPQVTGADDWHINSDEPSVLDYNTNFKATGQITSFYAAMPFRSSDHDPVIIGLNLGKYNSTTPNSPSYTVIVQTAGTGIGQVEQKALPTTTGSTARLQLNAIAESGSRFVGWSERFAPECVGTNPMVTVTVNAIKTCIATFEKIPLKAQTINFAPVPAKQLGDPDFSLSASATSGLTVTFNSTTPTICSVNQNSVHLNNSGICNLTAQQLGNNQYVAAAPVSQSFNVAPRSNDSNSTGNGSSSTGNDSNSTGNDSNSTGNDSNSTGNDSNSTGNDSNSTGNDSNGTGNDSNGSGSTVETVSQLRGVSANGYVDNHPLIVGLLSSGKQRVLIRASSVFHNIDPKVSVFSYPDRKLLASNNNWNDATSAAELQQKQLAPARPTDAGMLVELPAGLLTVEMTALVAGVGIVEVYDLGVFNKFSATSYAFKGISVNAMLNDYPIIAGLLVTGDKKRMLLRAAGLETGIDPELEVFSYPDRRLLATNHRWATSAAQLELQQKHLAPPRETDAATVAELSQGLFTVEVTRAAKSPFGRSIIEIYEMTVFH